MPTRPLESEDLPSIAELFVSTFRPTEATDSALVAEYMRSVYLENPWVDDDIRPLVYEGRRGCIEGFLGVIPRPMLFRGKTIRAAIMGNLMVAQGKGGNRNPLAAIDLTRTVLRGSQDLCVSDTASDTSRKLWRACGGTVAPLFGFDWIRAFRPLRLVGQSHRSSPRFGVRLAAVIARGLGRVTDAALCRLSGGPFAIPRPSTRTTELVPETLLELLDDFMPHALRPAYDSKGLEWILLRLSEMREQGRLRARLVASPDGEPAGWFLYLAKPGGMSTVLQVVAREAAVESVLDALLADAGQSGTLALRGKIDPRFTIEYSRKHCRFSASASVLVHSRDPELAGCVERGDALLTGLESEQWTQFVGDSFRHR